MACIRHRAGCGASPAPGATRSVAVGCGRAGGPRGGHLSFRSLPLAGPGPAGLACAICSHTRVFKWLCFLSFLTPVCITFRLFCFGWASCHLTRLVGSIPFSG